MNDKQENKLSMFIATEDELTNNNSLWAGVPKMVAAVTNFSGKIVSIQSLREVQEENLKGITQDKEARRETMVDLALKVSGGVMAYADDNNNNALKKSVSYSRSALLKGRDTTSKLRCTKILNKANPIISSLNDYGITPSDLTALQGAISTYSALIGTPRTARATEKAAGEQMEIEIKEATKILKEKIDKMMRQYIISAPEFHKAYSSCREIMNIGVRHEATPTPPPPPPAPPSA